MQQWESQIKGLSKYDDIDDMDPEEAAEQDSVGSGSQSAEYWIEPQPHERPGRAVACCILKAFHECQGEQHRKNQAQDYVAIPRPVQKAPQLTGT